MPAHVPASRRRRRRSAFEVLERWFGQLVVLQDGFPGAGFVRQIEHGAEPVLKPGGGGQADGALAGR